MQLANKTMRFVIIYHNKDYIRSKIEEVIPVIVARGFKFNEKPFQCPIFSTRLEWPSEDELRRFTFNTQCEEIEYNEGRLTSLRKHIEDAQIME